MNPGGTALALLLAGASLWFQAGLSGRRSGALATAFGLAVAVVGLVQLVGYSSGWDAGPDRLLVTVALDHEAMPARYHNGMAPNTAAAMLLAGLALVGISARARLLLASQAMALLTVMIAILTLLGYAYSAQAPIGVEHFIPMTLNTVLGLGVLSVGILSVNPDRGVMAVIGSPGAGGVIARRLIPAAVIVHAIIGGSDGWPSLRDWSRRSWVCR